jgi:hypothetical protein
LVTQEGESFLGQFVGTFGGHKRLSPVPFSARLGLWRPGAIVQYRVGRSRDGRGAGPTD